MSIACSFYVKKKIMFFILSLLHVTSCEMFYAAVMTRTPFQKLNFTSVKGKVQQFSRASIA